VTKLPKPFNLFAAEVQYWRLEPRYWEPILVAARDAGLPGISSYVPWEVHEVEKGRFDFDGSTDPRLNLVGYLELVKKVGLRLAYRPGPFVCNEMAWGGHPRRIVMGDVGMMVWQADNSLAPGYMLQAKEGWQPSYLHPAYLDEVRTWFAAVDAVARDFTVARRGPISTCNLDNEVSYIVRDSFFGADYNPCVVGRGGLYHQWLARTYGSPYKLPYRQRVASFEDIEPPRKLENVEDNLRWYFDWVAFKEWLMAEYLKTLRGMHEECGLRGVTFYTNINPHRPEGVPTNFARFAEGTGGLVGYDFYRNPWLSYSGYSSMARVLKLMNATLPVTWSAEFMGGWWFVNLQGNRVPRNHTEFMSLAAMADGCKAISWFMFHDRHSWGDAPVSQMGHRRENHEALRNVVGVARSLKQWNSLKPVSDLAIAYYRPYMWHSHLGDPMPCADNDLHVGDPVLWGEKAGAAVAEYEGLFRLAGQAGYHAAAVDISDAPEKLTDHRLVWLAAEPFIEESADKLLAAWVRKGGTLVVSHAWPRVNLAGQPLDFLGLGGPPDKPAKLGKGKVVWWPGTAAAEPGKEDVQAVAQVKALLADLIGLPAVAASCPPVTTMHSSEGRRRAPGAGDGSGEPEQHNLVEAILHQAPGAKVLYLLNLYDRAVNATVSFRRIRRARLVEIGRAPGAGDGSGEAYRVSAGVSVVDIDRKSARVFRVVR